ncbi:DUF3388 domain-containing protein, partial [Bacillus cereus]|nr:DUF3388 domain-containing protein [Bacillus cereus]
DGIVSTIRSNERHYHLLQEIMSMPSTKVIEHPDVFVRESGYSVDDFNIIIELRNNPAEEIIYDTFTASYTEDL